MCHPGFEPRTCKLQDRAYTTVLLSQSAIPDTRHYNAQCFMYPMKTVHRVQLFVDTFCQKKKACNSESSVSALPELELSELELELETTSPLDEAPDELLDESAAGALAAMQISCRALSSPLSSQVCTTRTLHFFPLSLRVLRLRVWKRLRSPDFAAACSTGSKNGKKAPCHCLQFSQPHLCW